MDYEWIDGNIRFVVPEDATVIQSIYAPYVANTSISFETEIPSVKTITERIKTMLSKYPYLVYETDSTIIGYAYASRYRDRAAYRFSADVSVYVAPEHHRHGVGKALYSKLFDLLIKQNIYTIYAAITLPNEASIGLHKSLGFHEVGVYQNVGYKHGKWLDVIWLEKPLREYDTPEEDRVW